MERSAAFDLRCPTCAAHVPAGAQWCTLCYADLRPAPAPLPDPEPPLATVPDPEPAAQEETPGRGKHARRDAASADTASNADVEAVAAQLLAELAASESGLALGRYSGLVDTTGKKVALMAGGAVTAMAVLFFLMAVLGSLL